VTLPTGVEGGLPAPIPGLTSIARQSPNIPRLHPKDIMRRYNISRATLYRWLRKKRLPRPRRIAGLLWPIAELEKAEQAGQLPSPVSA